MSDSISESEAIACHVVLLILSLSVILTRAYVRLVLEASPPQLPDYLTAVAWLLTLGWATCSIVTFHLGAMNEDLQTQVSLLKAFYASNFFFDMGLYFPKASILAFYYHLIPPVFTRVRIALYSVMGYLASAWAISFCLDAFWCLPISDNWSIENSYKSVWNSWFVFRTNYAFNISSDLLIFVLPFFLLPYLKLPRRQKWGLVGVFSLGLITMLISISRFVWDNLDLNAASDDVWCTAEMSGACIVVSLPSLKILLKDRLMVTRFAELAHYNGTRRTNIAAGDLPLGTMSPPLSNNSETPLVKATSRDLDFGTKMEDRYINVVHE